MTDALIGHVHQYPLAIRERALDLWATGKTVSQIRMEIGAGETTIDTWIGRARRSGDARVIAHRSGSPTRWTPELIAHLTTLWGDGLSCSQIAEALGGFTRNAIIGKAHRLKLSGRKTPIQPAVRHVTASPPQPIKVQRSHRAKPAIFLRKNVATKSLAVKNGAVIAIPMIPLATRNVSLLELADRECHFPLGDPQQPGFAFCGLPAITGSAYCLHHHALCWVPAPLRKARAA